MDSLLNKFSQDTLLSGNMSLSMNVETKGVNTEELRRNFNGQVFLHGSDIKMYGIDADKFLEKFKHSQSFNLVDVGAFMLAGPIGITLTKGVYFTDILVMSSGEETRINKLSADWKITNGVYRVIDVAISTINNRIAAKGWMDINTDSLNFTFAVLDEEGCSILNQDIYGRLTSPEMGKVKIANVLFAPTLNLVEDIFGGDCDAFYEGAIIHPE